MGVPGHVMKHVMHGTAALGLGITIERGMGFAANVLAARFGGERGVWGVLAGDYYGEQYLYLCGWAGSGRRRPGFRASTRTARQAMGRLGGC